MRERRRKVLVATEAVLVVLLLLLTDWQFVGWASPPVEVNAGSPDTLAARIPYFGMGSLMFGLAFLAVLYGVLQFAGRTQAGFLLFTVAILLPQGPGVWTHNNLEWGRLVGLGFPLGEGHPLLLTAGLFVASLVGLVVLHRVLAMRKLGEMLRGMRSNDGESDGILVAESKTLAGVVCVSLIVALLLVVGGSALGRANWLSEIVPWAVLTIGGGASLLLVGFTVLLLRGLNRE